MLTTGTAREGGAVDQDYKQGGRARGTSAQDGRGDSPAAIDSPEDIYRDGDLVREF